MKLIVSLACLAAVSHVSGQFSAGFETSEGYAGTPTGAEAAGQLGWFTPIEGSALATIHEFKNNSYGFSRYNAGWGQFMVCAADAGSEQVVSRIQHDVTVDNNTWTMVFDWNGKFVGQGAATDYLGSVSLQPSTISNQFQTLYRWTDLANPTTITAEYGVSDASGIPIGQAITSYLSPGSAWRDLNPNHWYRSSTTWNFATGQILEVSIQDLTTGTARVTAHPEGWFLSGGSGNVQMRPLPSGLRFFAGGTASGNAVAFDNVFLVPELEGEALAPVSEQILLGTVHSGGNLASWAADDNNPRTICKFFVPSITTPFLRIKLDFQTDITSPRTLKFRVKIASSTPGRLGLDLRLADKKTNFLEQTSLMDQIISAGGVYEGYAFGSLDRFVSPTGRITGELGIWQRGPSTSFYPCTSFESANVIIAQ